MRTISVIIISTIMIIFTGHAEDKNTVYILHTVSGDTYKDFVIIAATDSTVKIIHTTGEAEIKISDLTPESLKAIQPKLDELKKKAEAEKPKDETVKTVTAEPAPAKRAIRDHPRLAKAALIGTKEGCEAYNR